MNNKVKFLRGTATEYEASTKDNDTFYYTTDDEKLYLGNKEITNGGVTIDDTLSDTSKNPVQNKVINAALNSKANLSDIPTALPADGGNADTLDGKSSDKFLTAYAGRKLTTSVNGNLYGTYYCEASFTPDYPLMDDGNKWGNYGLLDARIYGSIFYQTMQFENGIVIHRARIAGATSWTAWQKLCDGGNAATVNGLTVQTAVPANAKFTDTTYGVATTSANGLMSSTDKSKLNGIATGANKYTHPSYTARTGVPTGNQTPAFGGTFTVSQPVSDATGHITAINSRTITIPSTAASASAAGLVSTAAQTFAGNKTFNGQVIPAGASAVGTAQARKIYAGTSDMTAGTTALETGAIYLVYE